jgi:hypothetical protein
MHLPASSSAIERATALSKTLLHMPRSTLNYLRVARRGTRGEGWRVAPFFAYSYGLLVHYITLEQELAELSAAGFQPNPDVFEDTHGAAVHAGDAQSDVVCFNVLARK